MQLIQTKRWRNHRRLEEILEMFRRFSELIQRRLVDYFVCNKVYRLLYFFATDYYQWVPFILGLQTIMFYLPHIAWQNVTFNRLGADLTAIIVKGMDALKTSSPENREKMIENVAKRLELLLFAHRDIRRGRRAAVVHRLHKICGIFLVSKRMGELFVHDVYEI